MGKNRGFGGQNGVWMGVFVATALLFAACGGSSDGDDTSTEGVDGDVADLVVAAEELNSAVADVDADAVLGLLSESCQSSVDAAGVEAALEAGREFLSGAVADVDALTYELSNAAVDGDTGSVTISLFDDGTPVGDPTLQEWVLEGSEWRSTDCIAS